MAANTDRVVFNTLERLLSSDMNDAEAMIGRVVADLLGRGFSTKTSPVGPSNTPRSFTIGLDLVTDGGNNALLTPGVLVEYNTTYPAAVGALESPWRIGFLRAPLAITLPVTGGATNWLLEARIVDVVTSTQTRDVFNPGLQTFAPASLTKQVERQIQTQWVGPSSNWPAPSGGSWVPLLTYFVPGGAAAPLVLNSVTDLRPHMLDGTDSAAFAAQPYVIPDDATWFDATFATFRTPLDGATTRSKELVGSFRGRAGGCNMQFLCRAITNGRLPQIIVGGFSDVAKGVVYFYLAPVRWAGGKLIPRFSYSSGAVVSQIDGILIASLDPPRYFGAKCNGAILDCSASFLAAWNGGIIPIGDALYVGAAINTAGGNLMPMAQTSGGVAFTGQTLGNGTDVISGTTDGGGLISATYDLRDKIPGGARAVRLHLEASHGGSTGGATSVRFYSQVGGIAQILLAGVGIPHFGLTGCADVVVPLGGSHNANTDQVLIMQAEGPAAVVGLTINSTITGWEA